MPSPSPSTNNGEIDGMYTLLAAYERHARFWDDWVQASWAQLRHDVARGGWAREFQDRIPAMLQELQAVAAGHQFGDASLADFVNRGARILDEVRDHAAAADVPVPEGVTADAPGAGTLGPLVGARGGRGGGFRGGAGHRGFGGRRGGYAGFGGRGGGGRGGWGGWGGRADTRRYHGGHGGGGYGGGYGPMYLGPAYDPYAYGGQGPTADVYDFVDRWPEGETEEEIVDVGGTPVRILRHRPEVPRGRRMTSVSGEIPLAEIANVLSPGCRGLDIHLEFGDDGQLSADVRIDGSRYRGTAEIAPLLQAVAQRSASTGDGDGGRAAMAEAVDVAGTILAGALVEQHERVISGGWWGAIKGAVNAVVVNPTKKSYKYTGKVLKKFKVPITIAATAVATVYGGPAGGAAAAKLTGPLIDGLAGKDGPKVAEAARAAAAGDPKMEKAVSDAERAVANTTAAYHLVSTAADAAQGDKEARGRIVELVKAAKTGDRAADSALGAIAEAFELAIAKRAQADAGNQDVTSRTAPGMDDFDQGGAQGAGTDLASMFSSFAQGGAGGGQRADDYGDPMPPEVTASGDPYDIVGAAPSLLDVRAEASEAAQAIAGHGALFVGYVKTADSRELQGEYGAVTMTDSALTTTFDDGDAADAWLGSLAPSQIVYAAYFDTSDPTFPGAVAEKLGRALRPRGRGALSPSVASGAITTMGGVVPWVLAALGLAGIGAYRYFSGFAGGGNGEPEAPTTPPHLVKYTVTSAGIALPWMLAGFGAGMGGALAWNKYGRKKTTAEETVESADKVISGALAPMLAFGLGAGMGAGSALLYRHVRAKQLADKAKQAQENAGDRATITTPPPAPVAAQPMPPQQPQPMPMPPPAPAVTVPPREIDPAGIVDPIGGEFGGEW